MDGFLEFEVGLAIALLVYLIIRQEQLSKPRKAVKGRLKLMPATISVGKTAIASLQEFDAANNIVPNVGPVTIASSDPTIASVGTDGATLTGVKAGTVTVTGTDAGDNITASDTLTVTDPAVSGKLVLTPQ